LVIPLVDACVPTQPIFVVLLVVVAPNRPPMPSQPLAVVLA
jgi:hypothetical protein